MTTRQAPPPRSTIVGLQADRSPSPQPSRIPPPDGDDSAFYAALIHEYSEHEARVDGAVRLLAAKVDVAIEDVRTLSMAGSTQRKEAADMAVRLATVSASVAAIKLTMESLLPIPQLLRDLSGAVARLDERLNRTEKRGASQSEIVERVALLHVDDETTEVKARSLAQVRKHRLRSALIKWFAVVLLPLFGAVLHRWLGGG